MTNYINIHILQTVPSNNINRDDTGASKTAVFGGVLRSRVSSQAWKKAVRDSFQSDHLVESYRTKYVPMLLARELEKLGETDPVAKAAEVFKAIKIGTKEDKNGKFVTSSLFFISHAQLTKIAKYVHEREIGKEAANEIKKILQVENSLDLALFGRMVADDASLNVDAACQVAHAFGVTALTNEFDFFTAVDDVTPTGGSAMLDSTGFNSSTLYRYANINLDELAENLGDRELASKGASEFIKRFVTSMPTGKMNSYANCTLPQYVLLTRSDSPVKTSAEAVAKLEEKLIAADKLVGKPAKLAVISDGESEFEQSGSLTDAISEVID